MGEYWGVNTGGKLPNHDLPRGMHYMHVGIGRGANVFIQLIFRLPAT
jgi:hypothetical protein